ncbi:MAG TPA: transposase [Bradyrhizobium sp.]
MAKHRSYSIEFKRQVVQDYLSGETLHGLGKRHDISRNLIRIWIAKHEAGTLDSDTAAASVLTEYEARMHATDASRPVTGSINSCGATTARVLVGQDAEPVFRFGGHAARQIAKAVSGPLSQAVVTKQVGHWIVPAGRQAHLARVRLADHDQAGD